MIIEALDKNKESKEVVKEKVYKLQDRMDNSLNIEVNRLEKMFNDFKSTILDQHLSVDELIGENENA